MKILLKSTVKVDGKFHAPGACELPDKVAKELVTAGLAEKAPATKSAAPAPAATQGN